MSTTPVRAGRLDKLVSIEAPADTVDKYGDPVAGWAEIAKASAHIRPMGVSERLASLQMQSGQTHVVTTRYTAALAAAKGEWRILFKGRVFQLVGQPRNPDEANVSLVFDCTEGPTP